MQLTFIGTDGDFIGKAFFDSADSLDSIEATSVTATRVVVENSETGYTATFTGTGFAFNAGGNPTAGTVTGVSISLNGAVEGTLSGISWHLPTFLNALIAIEGGNFAPMAALFDAAAPIVVDASGGQTNFDFEDYFQDLVREITQPITFTGSEFAGDSFQGGFGNDSVTSGSAGIFIDDAPGSDRYDISAVTGFGWVGLEYDDYRSGVRIAIDGAANTGSIQVGADTDTVIGAASAMLADGFSLSGSTGNDTVTLNTDVLDDRRQWVEITALEGDDTITVSGDGTVRLTYNWAEFGVTAGLRIDLSTGVVANDGTGGTDQINDLGGNLRIEVRGTNMADVMTGSSGDERFITELGNDTVNGGDGWDAIRYDRSGVGAVQVDLSANTASGTWYGQAFTDTLSNIEEVRGSRDGDDILTGDDGDNYLAGRGGNDSLHGGAGQDTVGIWDVNEAAATITDLGGGTYEVTSAEGTDFLTGIEYIDFADARVRLAAPGDLIEGDDSDETLAGGANDDTITAGRGDDSVEAGDGDDEISGDGGMDTLDGGAGNDLIRGGREADTIYGGDGDDVIRSQSDGDLIFGGSGDDNIKGGGGNDTIYGEDGNDYLKGGTRKDVVDGGGGDDKLFGNSFDDTLIGGGGSDRLNGGGENDLLVGGEGDDFLKGGAGDDVFVFDLSHGADVIADFGDGADTLRIFLDLADGLDAQDIEDAATVVGGSLVLDFGGGDSITLNGITDATGLAAFIEIV